MNPKGNKWSAKWPLFFGFLALFSLILGLGAWSVKVNISGAVVTSGLIEVEINRQVVQHPDGGVIKEILVDDGDLVSAGDVLLRFDDEFLLSELTTTNEQLIEIRARKARLIAERDSAKDVNFSEIIRENYGDKTTEDLIAGQRRLFFARKDTFLREASLLEERKAQIGEQIVGAEGQIIALQKQQTLILEELTDEKALLDKGLSQASTVRSLQREAARIEGIIAELVATVAERRGKIAETDINILRLDANQREEAITKLRDMQYHEIELKESQKSLSEVLQRMDVRAPSSGVIYGKNFHALRSVVQPAEPILYIVPQDSALVIAAKIPDIHIDQAYVGQEASLRFSAFDSRTTPVIFGEVTKLSPDAFVDENTGESYYTAVIIPNSSEISQLDGLELLPGMPVEAFLKTTDRTPLEYLVKPLSDYFNRAFRED